MLLISVCGCIVLLIIIFSLRNQGLLKNEKLAMLEKQIHTLNSTIEQLKESNDHLMTENKELDYMVRLVKQSPNAIMMMDKQGNVLTVNQGFVNMYEYTYDEFIEARGSNYRRTSFSPKVLERIEFIMKSKIPVKYEALNITKTGKELWTQTALMPLVDTKGQVDGMVTIDTDIHKRIVASDKLIERMESINQHIDTMTKQFSLLENETQTLFESINQLQELINKTDETVKLIKDISDRTKILGINATIEASIAGSYGRGFRIIANEIVLISNKTIECVSSISQLFSSVNTNREQLTKEKEISEEAITCYQTMIKTLKSEIIEVEEAINDFKTLT